MSSKKTKEERIEFVKQHIGAVPDFPKKGILFRDIFPMTRTPPALAECVALLTEHIQDNIGQPDVIVGLDARGFIFGPLVAQKLSVAFVPVRKAGKLPGETVQVSYQLEYGSDSFECQKNSILPGQKVVIIDDLLATGGTMSAAHELVTTLGGNVLQCMVVIELSDLKGREKVPGEMFSLFTY